VNAKEQHADEEFRLKRMRCSLPVSRWFVGNGQIWGAVERLHSLVAAQNINTRALGQSIIRHVWDRPKEVSNIKRAFKSPFQDSV
jgi:hypothetical protein